MECFWCGSFNHSADRCPGVEPEMKRNEKGQYLCPKCGRAWGQNNYAVECCGSKWGKFRKGESVDDKASN